MLPLFVLTQQRAQEADRGGVALLAFPALVTLPVPVTRSTSPGRSTASAALSVAGEASDSLVEFISGGQPVVPVRDGRPVVVVLDVDSYEEAETAVSTSG